MPHFWTAFLFFSLLFQSSATACTTFSFGNGQDGVVGKSYDWDRDLGAAVVNKRGMAKRALIPALPQGEHPAEWVSRFGSITFVQHGREFPISGMNEQGLVVEVMMLPETVYPRPNSAPVINELQWVQYQLDNRASTTEVVQGLGDVRIMGHLAKLHYMVCDRALRCATIDFLSGTPEIHWGDSLPVATLTNHTYSASLAHLSHYKGFGGTLEIPLGMHSLERFVRFSALAREFVTTTSSPVDYAFSALAAGGYRGHWNLVYEPMNATYHYRTLSNSSVKSFRGAHFDYDCRQPTLWQDMNSGSGDVTSAFHEYLQAENVQLVTEGTDGLDGFTPELAAAIAAYPNSTRCTFH